MAESVASNTGSDLRFHNEISEGSLSQVEMYHHLMQDNKQVIYEIKIGIISVIGSLIIIVCLIYIVVQCKRNSTKIYTKLARNRRPLDGRRSNSEIHSSTESLLHTRTHITLDTKSEQAFFV